MSRNSTFSFGFGLFIVQGVSWGFSDNLLDDDSSKGPYLRSEQVFKWYLDLFYSIGLTSLTHYGRNPDNTCVFISTDPVNLHPAFQTWYVQHGLLMNTTVFPFQFYQVEPGLFFHLRDMVIFKTANNTTTCTIPLYINHHFLETYCYMICCPSGYYCCCFKLELFSDIKT